MRRRCGVGGHHPADGSTDSERYADGSDNRGASSSIPRRAAPLRHRHRLQGQARRPPQAHRGESRRATRWGALLRSCGGSKAGRALTFTRYRQLLGRPLTLRLVSRLWTRDPRLGHDRDPRRQQRRRLSRLAKTRLPPGAPRAGSPEVGGLLRWSLDSGWESPTGSSTGSTRWGRSQSA
jgi:hypothetical protein